ncbi:MAG: VTT domain-containing protein [Pseudomonadota bacterium]
MAEFLTFLISYGYCVIFLWVFLDQAGLPMPAMPLMLAAGALAGMGELSVALVLLTTVLATVPIDVGWYYAGKIRGGRVLNLLCAISLEPDYCVRNTESVFTKLGPLAVVVSKFVPGLQTLAPPMAGFTSMPVVRFVVLDTIGTLLFAGLFVGLGWLFHEQLEVIAAEIASYGTTAGIIIALIAAAYLGIKLVQRQVFLRSLKMRRLTPVQLQEMMSSDDDVHVIDLRHSYDYDLLPHVVPGALRVPMEAIERHYEKIPRDSRIILYCS